MNKIGIYIKLKDHSSTVTGLDFSINEKLLGSCSWDKNVKIWNANSGEKILNINCEHQLNGLLFLPDMNYIVIISSDKNIIVWNINKKKEEYILQGHRSSVVCVKLSPNGRYIATGSEDKTVKIWDLNEKKSISTFEAHFSTVSTVAFSPNGVFLASGSWDCKIKIWNIIKKRQESTLNSHSDIISSLAYSVDGCYLAFASSASNLEIWNIQEYTEEYAYDGFFKLAYTKDENCFNMTSRTGLKNLGFYTEIRNSDYSSQTRFLCSFSGRFFASYSQNNGIKIIKLSEPFDEFFFIHKNCEFNHCLCFSYNEKYIALGCSTIVRCWNIHEKTLDYTFEDHSDLITCISFSVNNDLLAVGCTNKEIKIWRIFEQKVEKVLKLNEFQVDSLSFSSNHILFTAISHNKGLLIWNLSSNELIFNIESKIMCSRICPDNIFLVVGYKNGKIVFYNILTKSKVFELSYFTLVNPCIHLLFTRDGKFILASNKDETYQISFIKKLSFLLDEYLSISVRKRKNIKKLHKDSKVVVILNSLLKKYPKSKFELEKSYSKLVSKLLVKDDFKNSNSQAKCISSYFFKFIEMGIRLNFISFKARQVLYDFFLKHEDTEFNTEDKYELQILIYLMHSNLNANIKSKINICIKRLFKKEIFELKLEQNSNFYSCFHRQKLIDLKDMQLNKIKTTKSDGFYIHHYRSNNSQYAILIKKYVLKKDLNVNFREKIIQEIIKEANCYDVLNRNTPKEFFICKYFGCNSSKNSFSVVIQDYGQNLVDFIKENRENKFSSIINTKIYSIIKSLLNSFIFMETKNILHRRICPSSFQIDKNFQLKLNDFLYSAIKQDNQWHESNKALLPKGNKNYLSPEEISNINVLNLEQCEIYSLGLVLLELIFSREISEMVTKLDDLLDELRNTKNLKGLKKIIKIMLSPNPKNRLNFRLIYDSLVAF